MYVQYICTMCHGVTVLKYIRTYYTFAIVRMYILVCILYICHHTYIRNVYAVHLSLYVRTYLCAYCTFVIMCTYTYTVHLSLYVHTCVYTILLSSYIHMYILYICHTVHMSLYSYAVCMSLYVQPVHTCVIMCAG